MSFTVKITILSDTRYLALVRQLVAAVAKISGRRRFPKKAESACTLALIEAVDNAIFHVHHGETRLPVGVEISVGGREIIMTVVDCGRGFKNSQIHAPELVATKGRGLYIMDRVMNSVETRLVAGGHSMILKYNL